MACCWVTHQNQLSAESSALPRRCKVQAVCMMCAAALVLHASPLDSATAIRESAACVLCLCAALLCAKSKGHHSWCLLQALSG